MTMQGWGVKTIAGLGMFAGWFLACAGDDIPPVEEDLREALGREFGGAPSATAGSSGSGTGGRGGAAAGGRGGTGGSANAAGGAGGDGGGEPVGGGGSGGGVVPECDAFPILQRSCGLSGCHSDGVAQGSFAVSEDDVLDFVDQPSVRGADCGNYIDSANPEESMIYTRLTEAGCGNLPMPLTGDPLTPEEEECVLGWLQQFAE